MKAANRVSGIQAAQQGVSAQLEAWRNQMSPREYAVVIDVVARMIAHEQHRAARWLRRTA